MRLVRYEDNGWGRIGILRGAHVVPTNYEDLAPLIRDGRSVLDAACADLDAAAVPLEAVKLLAPIDRPGKILCTGINYASHKDENPAAVLPVEPFFFSKLPSAVIGPGDPIVIPTPTSQVDYEVELAVVIGKTARRVARGEALEHVFGYTVINDVSARDVQFKDQQITLGKGFDTFCPMGPAVTLADEVPDPATLVVESYVNGERRQRSPTAAMLFDVSRLVELLSRHVTLEPGDVISTGTPAGCGAFRRPPRWLQPGDVVDVVVDRVGRLTNPVVAGW